MQQLLYISTVRRELAATLDPAAILAASRRNNARDNVTGLLFYDGKRFLQALEGEEGAVGTVFARIQQDDRHRGLVILSRRAIAEREFGNWAMAYRATGDDGNDPVDQVMALAATADPSVRATFAGFAEVRRAA